MFHESKSQSQRSRSTPDGLEVMRTVLPPRQLAVGAYSGHVVECNLTSYPWRKTSTNPDGLSVRVHVSTSDDSGAASVFDSIDITNRGRLCDFCRSLGIDHFDELDLEQLMQQAAGQPCRFTVKNIVPREGRNAGIPKAAIAAWV